MDIDLYMYNIVELYLRRYYILFNFLRRSIRRLSISRYTTYLKAIYFVGKILYHDECNYLLR